jgi:hypothetical protein
MAIIIGVKQSARTYQILQETNNFSYINSINSSNLLFLNVDENTNDNAVIRFKNNYEIGYINNKISVYNSSNLLTIDNSNINIYKDAFFHSNFKVNNYIYTSNNTTFFNNNIELNLNNNYNNSFKINFNNHRIPVFEVYKNNVSINALDLYTSNIRLTSNSILYTNYIDSPNEKPVVINNMAFAESLRIFTAKIIQNISLDNDIVFTNLIARHPESNNPYTIVSDDEWLRYMVDNQINISDPLFSKPNISVIKYLSTNFNDGSNIGGSNILEFNIKHLNSSNSNLVFSINNKGYLSIGSNYNSNIPLKINIAPESSNIIQYTNINDINKCFSINSNGFINIGALNFFPNQLNIYKDNNYDRLNSDLISLNINQINNTSNNNTIDILFKNNNNFTDFIFDISYIPNLASSDLKYNIIITNKFIKNNIIPIVSDLYTDTIVLEGIIKPYTSQQMNANNDYNDITDSYEYNITSIINYPSNFIIIDPILRIGNILEYKIYPHGFDKTTINTNNLNLFNKITINKTDTNKNTIFIFYIYIIDYNYIYTGEYYPKFCNYLNAKTNDTTIFNISQYGNVGIGTSYSDVYKLYIDENALINNINCKTIDNYLTKNISMCNCILNDIDTINNIKVIKSDYIISSNNFLSNINNNNSIINSNLTILDNGGSLIVNAKSIFGPNTNRFNNYLMTINCSNTIDGLAIKNDIPFNNPNLLIYSSCINSTPYIKLQSSINSYNIGLTSANNFQIKYNNTNTNISLFENNFSTNNLSLFDNSFNIFKDNNSNIKFYAGTIPIAAWKSMIETEGNDTGKRSSFNIYGNFNVYTPDDTPSPIISCERNINNSKIKMGIGIKNDELTYDSNVLIVNYDTIFNSNINVLNNIYLLGTILSISDCNLKTNIHKIENPLSKIETISGYTYTRTDTGNMETGLIAQEVLRILPEVINYNTNNNYTISYGNMCGILVECIKELNQKIRKLNDRIEKIENH